MDFKSIMKTDRLYWLGRYIERVYTTVIHFEESYDKMIEEGAQYAAFCKSLDIPNIYTSSEDFLERYPFEVENPDSIVSNMTRAYDNAIELREEIGSESLAYIQLACYALNRAAVSEAPIPEFQKVTDNILAFYGCADDQIEDENTRNLIKVGKRIERIDLYGRLKMPASDLKREVHRLAERMKRCRIHYRESVIENLNRLVEAPKTDYRQIVYEVDRLVEV